MYNLHKRQFSSSILMKLMIVQSLAQLNPRSAYALAWLAFVPVGESHGGDGHRMDDAKSIYGCLVWLSATIVGVAF